VVALDGERPSVRAGTPRRDCESTWTVAMEDDLDQQTIAVNANWPVLPRQPSTLSPANAAYAAEVSTYLAGRGLPGVPVHVDQIIRVDLDGDGTDEVLVSARHPDLDTSIGAKAGFYSIVLLRQVVGAAVETTALFEDLHLEADVETPTMSTGEVMSFGDLNGDDIMEIAIDTSYWEGGGVKVFDVASGTPEQVLTTDCGS